MIAKDFSARTRAATAWCALGAFVPALAMMANGCDRKASDAQPVATAMATTGESRGVPADGAWQAVPAAPPPAVTASAAASIQQAFGNGQMKGGMLGHGAMKPGAGGAGLSSLLPTVAAAPAPRAARMIAASAPPTLAPESQPYTAPEPAPVQRLSANARYATTYRPGGAALAAFDAAVQRGQIPGSYQDLVGDFGARYAPALGAPDSGALAISVATERAAVAPGGGSMNLLVTLASSQGTAARAPLSVHFVLDISGSMSGRAIDDAKNAVMAAIGKLEAEDDFSVVTFSDEAHLLVADGPLASRRAQVAATIARVQADGGTNIAAGLDLGYHEAHTAHAGDDAVRIVMLLSDGHANGGDTDPRHLANRAESAFQDGIQTSSFGLGPDYDAALMSRIADRGAGGYYYLADSSQIDPALSREIDARLRPVATAVELRVRLRPDVGASHVFGSHELDGEDALAVRRQELAVDGNEKKQHGIAQDRQDDAEGGMRFFIPAFARADRHAQMITLELPPGIGERRIASVEVRYKDRLLQKNVTRELPVSLRWAANDADSAATADPAVERVEQAFAAGETILRAADRVDQGDRVGARQLVSERVTVLRAAAGTLGEPRFLEDASRLDRLANAISGEQPIADALPLVVMLRGSAYGYL